MSAKRYLGCAAVAFAVLLALSPAAPAAEIVGKVVLSGKPAAEVVVSIEGVRVGGPADDTVYVIDHRDLRFVPHVLVVRARTTVEFKNGDGMPCRFYSISPAGIFVLRNGEKKPQTITFDRPGVIEVRCAEHSWLYAYVVVKENPYFALTNPKGRYQISHVPPGRYMLQAWYEGTVVKRKIIEVGRAKRTINFEALQPSPKARTEGLDFRSLTKLGLVPR
ncbi:MAG: carboxypeptidase regulatory-like domain-containing protein [Terriglobia bacterium]